MITNGILIMAIPISEVSSNTLSNAYAAREALMSSMLMTWQIAISIILVVMLGFFIVSFNKKLHFHSDIVLHLGICSSAMASSCMLLLFSFGPGVFIYPWFWVASIILVTSIISAYRVARMKDSERDNFKVFPINPKSEAPFMSMIRLSGWFFCALWGINLYYFIWIMDHY